MMDFTYGDPDAVRQTLADAITSNKFDANDIEKFPDDVEKLRKDGEFVDGVTGSGGVLADIEGGDINAIYELRVGADIGRDQIKRMSVDFGPKGKGTEIDIQLKNGDYVEVKNKDLDKKGMDNLKKKIDRMHKYGDIDGKTITIVSRNSPGPNSKLAKKAAQIEKRYMQRYGVDIEIKFDEIPANV